MMATAIFIGAIIGFILGVVLICILGAASWADNQATVNSEQKVTTHCRCEEEEDFHGTEI